MNPAFNAFMQSRPMGSQQQFNPLQDIGATMKKFSEFQKGFQGDPEQLGKQMVQSGMISQDQFNEAAQITNTFFQMMGR